MILKKICLQWQARQEKTQTWEESIHIERK
jgi:hypothetical protein